MSLLSHYPFWFPVRKFDDPVGLHKNFRYLEDFLKGLSTDNHIYASVTIAASDSVNQNADYVCNGSNDTAVIQGAIDFVEGIGGGYVLFYDGTFSIDELTVTESMLIRGFGQSVTTFERAAGSSGRMFNLSGDNLFTFQDILFDGQDIASTDAIKLGDNGGLTVRDCIFRDFPRYCIDAEVRDSDAAVVYGCIFSNLNATKGTAAVRLDQGSSAGGLSMGIVTHCIFKNFTAAVLVEGVDQVLVMTNVCPVSDVTYLVDVDSSGGTGIYGNIMSGGTIATGGGTYAEGHNNTSGHVGADTDAIHDNVASEISAITNKGVIAPGDFFLLEDSAAGNIKKHTLFSELESTISHDNIAGVSTDDHHTEAHTVASHSDTTGTGAELETLTDGSDADALHTHSADGIDTSAIHDDASAEISAITEKASPVGADHILIEDSEAANVKKRITITNLPGGADADAIHDNVAGEIAAIADKASPVGADHILIEDSEAGDAKKSVSITNLPGGADADAIHDNVAAEISAITEKASPVGADHILIEDSEAANVKKRITITNLPGGADADAIHDNVAAEISAITAKATPVAGDFLVIEDSAAANAKKSVTVSALEAVLSHDNIAEVSTDDHHAEAHTVASHSDTTGTGAELEELTDGSETTLHSHAGGGGGVAVPEWVGYLAERQDDETPHTDDDFFDNATKSGTELTVSGSATWTELRDVLSVTATQQTTGDVTATMFAITSASAPMTVETAVRFGHGAVGSAEVGYVGMGFTDGVISSSQHVSGFVSSTTSSFATNYRGRTGTLTNFSSSSTTAGAIESVPFSHMYIRTIWTGANAFEFTFSIDGVTWFKGPVGALTPTLTPTHFAVWLSTTSFESTDQLTASFDYLRVYDADLSI